MQERSSDHVKNVLYKTIYQARFTPTSDVFLILTQRQDDQTMSLHLRSFDGDIIGRDDFEIPIDLLLILARGYQESQTDDLEISALPSMTKCESRNLGQLTLLSNLEHIWIIPHDKNGVLQTQAECIRLNHDEWMGFLRTCNSLHLTGLC